MQLVYVLNHCTKNIHYCDKCGFPAAKKKKLKSHVETAHRDEDSNVTNVISR